MRPTRTGQQRMTVEDLGDAEALLLTISSARIQSFSSNYLRGGDEKVVITFTEFGDAEMVLNATSYNRLVQHYGGSPQVGFAGWVGRPCVLVAESTTDPRTNAAVKSLWVAGPQQWAEAVRSVEAEAPKPKRTRAKRASQ